MTIYRILLICSSILIIVLDFHQVMGFRMQIQLPTLANAPLKRPVIMKATESTKWDLRRFLKTARYYDVFTPRLPFVPRISSSRELLKPNEVLWTAGDGGSGKAGMQWGPLDDVVMGGASKSDLIPGTRFNGTWTGYTTTANNGGFAGIRTKLFQTPFDASRCEGLVLRVVGDGQRYKLIMRDDADWNGIAWSFSFDTKKDRPVTVKVPFDKLKPTKFARVVPGYRLYDKSQITGMQISLSKFEYDGGLNPKFVEGPFKLAIESISTFV